MKVVASFISTAAPALKGSSSGFRRAKPLIALPMPGVGLVDVADLIKDMENIVRPLISQLYAAANTYGVDVAICTVDEGAFKVAQVLRALLPFKGGPFWMLPAHMHEEVVRLKKQAGGAAWHPLRRGRLLPSGLPSWGAAQGAGGGRGLQRGGAGGAGGAGFPRPADHHRGQDGRSRQVQAGGRGLRQARPVHAGALHHGLDAASPQSPPTTTRCTRTPWRAPRRMSSSASSGCHGTPAASPRCPMGCAACLSHTAACAIRSRSC